MAEFSNGVEEFTIEVNPTTVSPEKASLLRGLGVNRVSLGAQSFDSDALAVLGRQHGPDRIRRTFQILRDAGFENIGIDLIYGVPGQCESSWWQTLSDAIDLGPEHLSVYGLTYEEDTPFFERLASGRWARDEALETRLFLGTRQRLRAAGYTAYEVSNFARPGFESRHNIVYWRGMDFLGIGPSAVSTIGYRRWRNTCDLGHYIAAAADNGWPLEEEEALDADLLRREKIMFGLRTCEGVHDSSFEAEFSQLHAAGYAERHGQGWRLTEEGLLRADAIAGLFVGRKDH